MGERGALLSLVSHCVIIDFRRISTLMSHPCQDAMVWDYSAPFLLNTARKEIGKENLLAHGARSSLQ